MSKHKVIVTVPPRPEYGNAYYALQRKFDTGAHVLEVTDEQLAELREQPVINVVTQAELDAAEASKPSESSEPEGDPAAEPKGPGKKMKR